jgi:hypothetical protein
MSLRASEEEAPVLLYLKEEHWLVGMLFCLVIPAGQTFNQTWDFVCMKQRHVVGWSLCPFAFVSGQNSELSLRTLATATFQPGGNMLL